MKKIKSPKRITAKKFDQLFDEGKTDILKYFEPINPKEKRINVHLSGQIVESLDTVSKEMGISRQDLIRTWIMEKINYLKIRAP